MTGAQEMAERMQALRGRFLERARAARPAIAAAWDAGAEEARRGLSPGLAGNAGMFGYAEIGEVARNLEDALSEAQPIDELVGRLLSMLDALAA